MFLHFTETLWLKILFKNAAKGKRVQEGYVENDFNSFIFNIFSSLWEINENTHSFLTKNFEDIFPLLVGKVFVYQSKLF